MAKAAPPEKPDAAGLVDQLRFEATWVAPELEAEPPALEDAGLFSTSPFNMIAGSRTPPPLGKLANEPKSMQR